MLRPQAQVSLVPHRHAAVSFFSYPRLAWEFTQTLDHRQNNVEELFSLFKFLGVQPLNDWHTFNEQIAKPIKANRTTRPMKRLHVSASPLRPAW